MQMVVEGVIGGPHEIFTKIESGFHKSSQFHIFMSEQYQLYKMGYHVSLDTGLLGNKCNKDAYNDLMLDILDNDREKETSSSCNVLITRNQKLFNEAENAGSEITYRCINCRNCQECKHHDQIEPMSLKEEVEQSIIDKSVTVDIINCVTSAYLPLLHKPEVKLAHNKHHALRVYNQQVNKLNRNPQDKADIVASENKLQSMGYVEFVGNLTAEQQKQLRESPNQYFIPWRAVWNSNSISTPCRLVFDASRATDTGLSLNDILAKGKNNMNKLVDIIIRWMSHKIAFHTDIRKMYNSVRLNEVHWCLQRYIWQEDLDNSKIPDEKIIKTLIYGVKSSGNQSERGLRETARLSQEEYPEVNQIVHKDIYVDDCLTGDETEELAFRRADELEIVLNRGGFSLKGVSFSGKEPADNLSQNGREVNVAGMRWTPKDDTISLDISELNFSVKSRGRKSTLETSKSIPDRLTRRHCVAKVAEIFDLVGKVTPLTVAMKIDLHELVARKLSWDDVIPDELRKNDAGNKLDQL